MERLHILACRQAIQLDPADFLRQFIHLPVHFLPAAADLGKLRFLGGSLLGKRFGTFPCIAAGLFLRFQPFGRSGRFFLEIGGLFFDALKVGQQTPALRFQTDPLFPRGGQFPFGSGKGRFLCGCFFRRFFQRRGGGFPLNTKLLSVFFDLRNLGCAAQQTGISDQRSAGQRSAGVDNLPVQRDDAEPVPVLPGDGGGAVEIFRNGDPAEEGIHNRSVCRIIRTELGGNTDKPPAAGKAALLKPAAADGSKRKECCTAAFCPLQKSDCVLCVLLIFGDNILHSSAEGGFQRDGIRLRNPDQAGNRSADPPQRPAGRLTHDGFDTAGKALQTAFKVFQEAGAADLLLPVETETVAFLFGFVPAAGAGFQKHLMPGGFILKCLKVFICLPKLFGGFLRLFLKGFLLLFPFLRIPTDIRKAERNFGKRRRGGHLGHLGFRSLRGQIRDPARKPVDFARRFARAAFHLFQAGGAVGKTGVPVLYVFFAIGNFFLLPGKLFFKVTAGKAVLLDFSLNPSDILLIVADIVAENGNFAFFLGGFFFHGSTVFTDPICFGRTGIRLAEYVFNLTFQPGNGLIGGIMLIFRNQDFILLLAQSLAGTAEFGKPQPDLQLFCFVCKSQVAFCLFGLLTERADAAFQLRENIVQAQKVLFRFGKAALRILLAVAETGNAGGFFKNLTAVFAARGHDTVNLSLTDNGISVAPKARIHKKLIDIP